MFRPHFTSGSGLFGKNNNGGTYIDQRGCSLAATHLEWMINGLCFVGIKVHSKDQTDFWRCYQVQMENGRRGGSLFVLLHIYKQRHRAKGDTNDISSVVSILNY